MSIKAENRLMQCWEEWTPLESNVAVTLATFQDGELYNISWRLNARCLRGFWLPFWKWKKLFLAGNYMFKVNNRNTRTRYKMCSKLTIQNETIGVVLVSFLYCQLWTCFKPSSNVSVAIFDQVNTGWLGSRPIKKGDNLSKRLLS